MYAIRSYYVACSYEAGFVDENGKVQHVDRILEADAVATVAGSLLGTSTTTTYIESASGIANGAKTGFASVITAAFFILALFFAPLIGIVPGYATAPALVIVGVYMFKNIRQINFTDFTRITSYNVCYTKLLRNRVVPPVHPLNDPVHRY